MLMIPRKRSRNLPAVYAVRRRPPLAGNVFCQVAGHALMVAKERDRDKLMMAVDGFKVR